MDGDTLGWLGFCFSLFIACWVIWDMLPDAIHTLVRRTFNLTLHLLNWMGAGAWWLLETLWRGQPQRAAALAPVSTVSQARPQAYVQPWRVGDDDPQTDRPDSGLSAGFEASERPDAAEAYIESLDSGSRKQAVAILVREGWGTGKIRNALVGDNGEIGREVAEARQRMGLAEPSPARVTPLAERELADGVEFRRQPAP